MGWCFAIVNNKLAEIYFEKKKNGEVFFYGHSYIEESEYTTTKEKKYIKEDTANCKYIYRKNIYKRISDSGEVKIIHTINFDDDIDE